MSEAKTAKMVARALEAACAALAEKRGVAEPAITRALLGVGMARLVAEAGEDAARAELLAIVSGIGGGSQPSKYDA